MPLAKIAERMSDMRFFPQTIALAFAISTFAGPVVAQVDLNNINPFGDEPAATPDGAAPAEGEQPAGAPPEGEQMTAAQAFEKAKELYAAGNYDQAIPILTQILNQSPSFVPAALMRGQAFKEIGEPQLALQSLADAVNYGARFNPAIYAESLAQRGKVLLELGNLEEAADDFGLAVQSAPSNAEYLFLRGRAYTRLAQAAQSSAFGGGGGQDYLRQGIASLSRAITVDPTYAEAYAERGNAYSISNRYEGAIADLEKAAELDGETANYHAQHGFIVLRRAEFERRRPNADKNQVSQDYQNAISAFDRYLNTEANKTKADFEEATPDIFRPNQVYIGRSSARIGLANHSGGGAAQRGLYDAAIADADRAYEFDETSQSSVTAMFQKGVAERLTGDMEKATDTFTDVLSIVPTFSEANIRRGICYYYLGDFEAARRDFEQAISISPLGQERDGRPEFWLGVTHAKEGDYESAVRLYSRSIRLNPRYKPAFSNRGLALMQLKQYRRAAGDFDELLRRNRKDSIARQRRDQAKQLMIQ